MTVEAVEPQKGLSDQARTDSIKKIYGDEGVNVGNKGEKVFKERAEFDKENPNASMVSKVIGSEKEEHNMSRSTPDTQADNA